MVSYSPSVGRMSTKMRFGIVYAITLITLQDIWVTEISLVALFTVRLCGTLRRKSLL